MQAWRQIGVYAIQWILERAVRNWKVIRIDGNSGKGLPRQTVREADWIVSGTFKPKIAGWDVLPSPCKHARAKNSSSALKRANGKHPLVRG